MNELSSCEPPFICLIRHGETPYSAARRYNGVTDAPLTHNGERVAALLQPVLSQVSWTTVLASNLSRARRTASLAGFGCPQVVEALHECDYGDLEGKTTEEILQDHPGWDFWRDGCPNGEDAADVASRLAPVVGRLRLGQGRILVFSHSHAIRILAAVLLGLEPARGAIFALEPARLNLVRIHRGRPEIALWNAAPPPQGVDQ
jgi:broad specificity phosphatase PhoE